ncbi:hypothetical protein N9L06_02525 [Mariniblastus sp.]|nr:hypothetical protein [Mariniblastus sp.]
MDSHHVRGKFDHPVGTAAALLFFTCLVLVPALLHHEPLKWQAAQAMVRYENGDRDEAIESLRQVASKLVDDQYIQFTLVDWLTENGQAKKAVEHFDRQLEHKPGSVTSLALRRESECGAGDYQAAWQTHQQLQELETQRLNRSAADLNEQAYFRALANVDLPTARSEIRQAVAKVSYDSGIPGFNAPLPSQALIAASLLSRHVDAQSLVLPHLNRRIDAVRKVLEDREKSLVELLEEFSNESFPLSQSREGLLKDVRFKVDFRRHELAFLTVCRALMVEDLGHPNRCDSDRAQIVHLGLQPQMVADLLPEDSICHPMATRAIAYLDTSALVLTKMLGNDPSQLIEEELTLANAITDLNISVAVCDVIDRRIQTAKESTESELKQRRKVFAAVLHHRVLAHQKSGNAELAQLDRERIKSLGFDPDANLH